MDCLPSSHEWSLETRWLLIQEHIEALRWHLEQLEAEKTLSGLLSAREHLQELCLRGVEAHGLLEQLSLVPPESLQSFG